MFSKETCTQNTQKKIDIIYIVIASSFRYNHTRILLLYHLALSLVYNLSQSLKFNNTDASLFKICDWIIKFEMK